MDHLSRFPEPSKATSNNHHPGRTIWHPPGYTAFMPAPLPLVLHRTADWSVGQLAVEGNHWPNPHLLSRPFGQRGSHALASSQVLVTPPA